MKKVFLVLAILSIVFVLSGCFEKQETPDKSGDIVKEITTTDDNKEFYVARNNGGGAVEYKGKIYYIEYNNNDYTRDALGNNFYKNQETNNSQRYVNVINQNGTIENLFKVTDLDSLYIVDDRFYLQRSTGMLYSVDMKGENDLDFARGIYAGFDPSNHVIYYTNANATSNLVEIDTLTMSISNNYEFDNEYIGNDYTYVGTKDGAIYYYTIDTETDEFVMTKHDIKNNKNEIVAKTKISRTDDEKDLVKISSELREYTVVDGHEFEDNKYFIVYGKFAGTMRNFIYGKLVMIDIGNESISFIENDDVTAMLGVIDNKLVYSTSKLADSPTTGGNVKAFDLTTKETSVISKSKYNINLDIAYGSSGQISISDEIVDEVKAKYKDIDLELKVPDEVVEKYPESSGYNMYDISVGNYKMVGDTLFYTIISSKLNPAGFIGWRPAYIRKALDVYAYDTKTNKTLYVYSVVNNVYEKMEEKIEEVIQSGDPIISGDFEVEIPEHNVEETLKENEMIVTINTNNIWQNEFDVRVEEVGGMIIGKRIEYEGHHQKSDGDIKIKVLKEVGAMLTVYVDNSLHSQMRIEEDM